VDLAPCQVPLPTLVGRGEAVRFQHLRNRFGAPPVVKGR